MTWYVLKSGVKQGPYSDEQLGELIERGHLKPDDLVWKPGLLTWMWAAEVPGLLTPPSRPPLESSNAESPTSEAGASPTLDQTEPPSGLKESSRLTDHASGKGRGGSYIARHWRGELSLPVSYWINGLLVSIVLTLAMALIPGDDLVSKSPKLYSTVVIALWVLLAIITIWQLAGIWNSANSYLSQGKSKLWGNFAKLAVVLGLIMAASNFVSTGIPQIIEYAKIATGEDPYGKYQLRVLRDATELEIAGAIVFGLTDDVRRTLDAHPTVRTIHLNSLGGRVNEARNLRDLIDSRGLTTFTASGCFSACTLAYAAGQKRLIAKDANLGFHQYSFTGLKERDFHFEYEKDKKDWLARGFTRVFVDKAFATPNNELWKPTHSELLEARFVTGYPESDDVAITGFKLGDLENIEAEFATNSLFITLKAYEPKTYDRLLSELRTGLQQGRSLAELRNKILPIAQSVYMQRLPYASDPAIRSFTGLMLEQMKVLYSVNPALCYEYIYQQEQGAGLDPTRYFSTELLQKESSVIADVIRSSAEQVNRPPKEKQIEKQLSKVFAGLAQHYGGDVQMLANPELGKANKAKMCQMTYELYQTILRLPERESGALLRFMFASEK